MYDSKKAGAVTISHLRFGPRPIRSAYLVRKADFVACHQFEFVHRYDVLETAAPGAAFLLNSPYGPDAVWDELPLEMQEEIVARKLRFFVVDAFRIAREAGLKGRINTIMQTCFFAITKTLAPELATERIKQAISDTYAKKGPEILKRNFAAVDAALGGLAEVKVPAGRDDHPPPPADRPGRGAGLRAEGDGPDARRPRRPPPRLCLPRRRDLADRHGAVGEAQHRHRDPRLGSGRLHPVQQVRARLSARRHPREGIRAGEARQGAPETFKSDRFRGADFEGWRYTIQVAPEDCTGCSLCVMFCPAKDKSNPKHKAIDMAPQRPLREKERDNYAFFLDLPEPDRSRIRVMDVKGSQFATPLFEYSGACAGCGETPYVKLLTQLFGDRTLVANATGCSSIYGGNLPTTPYTVDRNGRGPAWSNSLFEDNAEFGLGMRLALDSRASHARQLLGVVGPLLSAGLAREILEADQSTDAGIAAQRERVARLRRELSPLQTPAARVLADLADDLVKKTVWIVGGDGWAYDIGFGGLDHVLSLPYDVNVLVLDTEVYSNTGGQQSKATPLGAAAKFAVGGKETGKKDLGLMAMSYGHVYVARIAFGAKDFQTVKAIQEAEAYPGPSLVIAYSHCIAHGYDMAYGAEQQKLAVESGVWPLYRFDPRRIAAGEAPLVLDSAAPKKSVEAYRNNESRFRMLEAADPARYKELAARAGREAERRLLLYKHLSDWKLAGAGAPAAAPETTVPAETAPAGGAK